MNNQYKNIKRVSIGINKIAVVFIMMVLSLLIIGCPPYSSHYDYKDTDGLARGVAVQNIYAYVADGVRGLKILNISNPTGVNQVGALDLPGFNAQVHVRGDIAVLTDTDQNKIYIVNILDKFNPQLIWTYDTLDKPIAVFIRDGIVFIAERGADPNAGSYFSGLEAVSCSLSNAPAQLSSMAIADISDVYVPKPILYSNRFHVVSKNKLYILDRSPGGVINTTPVSTTNFSSAESIQSIDFLQAEYLLVFGKYLYVMDISNPSAPAVVDSKPVPGYEHNRVITTSGLVRWGYLPPYATGVPDFRIQYIPFCYSTLREFGWGRIDLQTKRIEALKQEVDVHGQTDGHAKLYDIKLIHKGGVTRELPMPRGRQSIAVVGALDNYGLAFEVLTEVTWQEFTNL